MPFASTAEGSRRPHRHCKAGLREPEYAEAMRSRGPRGFRRSLKDPCDRPSFRRVRHPVDGRHRWRVAILRPRRLSSKFRELAEFRCGRRPASARTPSPRSSVAHRWIERRLAPSPRRTGDETAGTGQAGSVRRHRQAKQPNSLLLRGGRPRRKANGLRENDPEGVAFEYEVLAALVSAGRPKKTLAKPV